MTPPVHSLNSILLLPSGRYVSTCICSWRSQKVAYAHDAQTEWNAHYTNLARLLRSTDKVVAAGDELMKARKVISTYSAIHIRLYDLHKTIQKPIK